MRPAPPVLLVLMISAASWAQDAPPEAEEDPLAVWGLDADDVSGPERREPTAQRRAHRASSELAVPDFAATPAVAPAEPAEVAPTPAVRLGSTATDLHEFEQTLGRNFASFAHCYGDPEAPRTPLRGRIELRWSIEAGEVTEAVVVENTTGDHPVAECIVSKIESWSFPAWWSREITYSLDFSMVR